ncbi:hypothetical protein CBR_g56635 [Chara braunii]|uniref:Oleosin n=1 Tax=Chara braunii TaxID=69332 RepID=A0A388MDN7_CHABU|nr:hypothetical protein CBR_g56635 [Chara braunii]|eukprot:GBG92670.1 hypothetical protein CBR_g56635 [Chara braunii]
MAEPKPWVDMPGLRRMSWRKMGAIGGALALAGVVLGGLLLLGLPVLLIGGLLLLLTSPCTCAVGCCTAPLWIPLLLFVGIPALIFFVTTGGIMLLLTVLAGLTGAAGWWIYRYNRGPMPPGGDAMQRVLDRLRGRSREVTERISKVGQQAASAAS